MYRGFVYTDVETKIPYRSLEEMEQARAAYASKQHEKAVLTVPAKALGICHNPEKLIIIQASCEYNYDENEHYLTFEKVWFDDIVSTNKLGDFILANIPTPSYSKGFFVNTKLLGNKLKSPANVVNCRMMLPEDIDDIGRLYRELMLGKRLKSVKSVLPLIDLNDETTQETINMLLYAFSPRLSGELQASFKPYGSAITPEEREYLAQRRSNGITGTYKNAFGLK